LTPTSEELTAWKEIVTPIVALLSLFTNLLFGYLQSKCRRDLDLAYAEIRYLKGGEREVRKSWQFWKPKRKRKMVKVPGIEVEPRKDRGSTSDR
jgi:hypothetical protein